MDDEDGNARGRDTLLSMRLQLKAGLPLVRRGPARVQIGIDARHGTVLDGLTAQDLELLDELATGVDDSRLARAGVDRLLRARTLVGLLRDTGVLQRTTSGRAALVRLAGLRERLAPDAAAWSLAHPRCGDGWELLAARRHARVELHGSGRTALALAATLAAAGVGTVRATADDEVTAADLGPVPPLPADVGGRTADVAARAVRRTLAPPPAAASTCEPAADDAADASPGGTPVGRGAPGEDGEPRRADLVVLVERAAADPTRGDRLLAADVPHLSVVVRETSVVVGPLVVPGRSACLRCLDLHRTGRDPQWPLVLAQLLRGGGRPPPREETALAQVAAGVAALQVLGHLDGVATPASTGATLEVELPDGLTSRRPWPAHPSCGCSWPPPAPPSGRPGTDPVLSAHGSDGRAATPATTMLW